MCFTLSTGTIVLRNGKSFSVSCEDNFQISLLVIRKISEGRYYAVSAVRQTGDVSHYRT